MTRKDFMRALALGGGATLLTVPGIAGTKGSQVDSRAFRKAVAAGELEEVRRMLDADPALMFSRDDRGLSMVFIAHTNGHDAVRDLLVERGAQLDLIDAIVAGAEDRVKEILDRMPGAAEVPNAYGWTAMCAAADVGNESMITALISAAGSYDIMLESGPKIAPVCMALTHEDMDAATRMANTMLSNGADPNIEQSDGSRPIHIAAARGNLYILDQLIRKGADVEATNGAGQTAKQIAADAGQAAAVKVLERINEIGVDPVLTRFAYQADGSEYSREEIPELPRSLVSEFSGVSHFNADRVKELLRLVPALAHTIAPWNEMGVEAGTHVGRPEIAQLALDAGAPMSLQAAIVMNRPERVSALLKEFPDAVRERGPHDWPLLAYPVIGGADPAMAEDLIRRSADPNAQNHTGTGLHWAAMTGNVEMAELFLNNGADPAIKRIHKDRARPIDLARAREHKDVVTLLQRFG